MSKDQTTEWLEAWQGDTEQNFFSWYRWYWHPEMYPRTRSLLQQHSLVLTTIFPWREGKCMDCGARMSISDVGVLIPGDHGGEVSITLISRYRDHNC